MVENLIRDLIVVFVKHGGFFLGSHCVVVVVVWLCGGYLMWKEWAHALMGMDEGITCVSATNSKVLGLVLALVLVLVLMLELLDA